MMPPFLAWAIVLLSVLMFVVLTKGVVLLVFAAASIITWAVVSLIVYYGE